MKAVLMTCEGAPDVLEYRDVPEPAVRSSTQIKVRLQAAGVNPVDTKLRARGVYCAGALPTILGCDGAGTVVEVGGGVTRFRPGDAVWFCNGGLGLEPGCYAEYAVVDETVARNKPSALDFSTAAAGPLVLITAWEALYDRAGLEYGQSVLIHAGAGGVGHVAVQLAKLRGATVIATAGSEERAAFVRKLGADEVILYKEQDFVAAVLGYTDQKGADVVLDTVGGETFYRSIEACRYYGNVVTLLDPGAHISWKEARNRNLRIGFELMLTPMLHDLPEARAHHGDILDRCAQLIDGGRLTLTIGHCLPLVHAARAHALLEAGGMQGKVVLEIE
jgi:NADPH2:quinone reductase